MQAGFRKRPLITLKTISLTKNDKILSDPMEAVSSSCFVFAGTYAFNTCHTIIGRTLCKSTSWYKPAHHTNPISFRRAGTFLICLLCHSRNRSPCFWAFHFSRRFPCYADPKKDRLLLACYAYHDYSFLITPLLFCVFLSSSCLS